ncbi:unannotated protein [freshwater metagenome]|uniref:Unannotated protein n=1 Tax=freshwater metagenome TaxID=449393 RepID=A0A6J6BJM2_9ZZZZ
MVEPVSPPTNRLSQNDAWRQRVEHAHESNIRQSSAEPGSESSGNQCTIDRETALPYSHNVVQGFRKIWVDTEIVARMCKDVEQSSTENANWHSPEHNIKQITAVTAALFEA